MHLDINAIQKMSFSFVVVAVVLAGCAGNNVKKVVIDNTIEFRLVDSLGNDLLNPENPNSIDKTKIKLFYLINNELQEVFDPTKNYTRNFFIYQHEDGYRIRVFLNSSEKEELPETYIQWTESDTDTIKAKFRRTTSLVAVQKIWLNEKEIGFFNNKSKFYFNLIK